MTTSEPAWDWHNLNDSIKTARERFMGKQVRVTAGGMWQQGILLGITQKREVVIQSEKNGVQTLCPLERIELIA